MGKYACLGRRCCYTPLTEEEREIQAIDREIQELEDRKIALQNKKSKDYARKLFEDANKVAISTLNGKTAIILD